MSLSESSGTISLEVISAIEHSLLVERTGDGGMNGDKILQTTHSPEKLHRMARSLHLNSRREFTALVFFDRPVTYLSACPVSFIVAL